MFKTAIFVEGQTELILIREFLLKFFEYQNITLNCYTLFTDSKFIPTEYAFEAPDPEFYFQIMNVGNDKSVLSRILNREKYLLNSGFEKIIGLRDMYSREYREAVKKSSVDHGVNEKFIKSHNVQIERNSSNPDKIFFHFVIMEVEAWLLGMHDVLARFDSRLTLNFIQENLEIGLNELDPEFDFFHPSQVLNSIFQLIERRYNKSKADVNSFVSYIEKSDYENLHFCNKCNSFSLFFHSLDLKNTE